MDRIVREAIEIEQDSFRGPFLDLQERDKMDWI
jgi:hypothetical protein